MSKKEEHSNFTKISSNHQEALRFTRLNERRRAAKERLEEVKDSTVVRQVLPVYEMTEPAPTEAPPAVYGWKHEQPIRHRRLDNQPRDQMKGLLQPPPPPPPPPPHAACGPEAARRRKHFKV